MRSVTRSTERNRQRRAEMKWVTRERPKIDRIACPWLITRFIDKEPEFLYVPPDRVVPLAEQSGATPYDIPGVKFSHVGDKWWSGAFLGQSHLGERALRKVSDIVGGADTWRLDFAPQAGGQV